MRQAIFLMAFCLVASAAMAAGPEGVAPPDVHARLQVVQAKLERIRVEVGKSPPEPHRVTISGVAPREVYFQASTLFRKSNRLSFEYTREIVDPPPTTQAPGPEEVLILIDSALDRISRVTAYLGIVEASPAEQADPSQTPTDVFRATLAANRQLNLLLDRPFSSAEAYQQLTLAVGYAARLRARFPGDRIPEPPPFERAKRPSDVMTKLFECFGSIQRIAAQSDLSMLELSGEVRERVTPSDVYDMATLLVSELDYLWSQADTDPPRQVYHPGRKLPSHVYQRAGLLQLQLSELEQLVDANPNWLSRN